jgi:hypothetical protein
MLLLKTAFDTSDIEAKLGEHKAATARIAKRCMARTFGEIKKEIRKTKLTGQVLKRKSGNLLKSIRYNTFKDFTGYIEIKPKSKGYYGVFHETGPVTILPKRKKWLTFQINGEWRKVASVQLPKREYMLPVVQDWFNGPRSVALMEKTVQEELNKIYEKAAAK